MFWKCAFIHLMAMYFWFLMYWAFNTSLKVPSPFLLISRYSVQCKFRSEFSFLLCMKLKSLFSNNKL